MIDFKITLQADELLCRDYEKMNLISEIMFTKLLRQCETKTALPPKEGLRRALFDLRAGNSNLAKVQCTKTKTLAKACYPHKITKISHFFQILVTSIRETDFFCS